MYFAVSYVEGDIGPLYQFSAEGTPALGEIDDLSAAFYMNSLQAHYKPPDKGAEDNVASLWDVHTEQHQTLFSKTQRRWQAFSLWVLFNSV